MAKSWLDQYIDGRAVQGPSPDPKDYQKSPKTYPVRPATPLQAPRPILGPHPITPRINVQRPVQRPEPRVQYGPVSRPTNQQNIAGKVKGLAAPAPRRIVQEEQPPEPVQRSLLERLLPSGDVDYSPTMPFWERPGAARRAAQIDIEQNPKLKLTRETIEGTAAKVRDNPLTGFLGDMAATGIEKLPEISVNKPGWWPDVAGVMEAMNLAAEFGSAASYNLEKHNLVPPMFNNPIRQIQELPGKLDAFLDNPLDYALTTVPDPAGALREAKSYSSIIGQYYEEVTPFERMVRETVLDFALPAYGPKFGAVNKKNVIKQSVELVGETNRLAYGPSLPGRNVINKFWQFEKAFTKSKPAKATQRAQAAYYKIAAEADKALQVKRVMLQDGRIKSMRWMNVNDLVDAIDNFTRDSALQTGQIGPEAARIMRKINVQDLPSVEQAKINGNVVNAIEFRQDLGDALLTATMREDNLIKPTEVAGDYIPNVIERASNNRKALTSIGLGWLTSPRTILRNGFGNIAHLLLDEVDLLGYNKMIQQDLQRMFKLDEIKPRTSTYGAAAGYKSKTGEILGDLPYVKQMRELALGDTPIIGETRAQNMAQQYWAPRVWAELYSGQGRGITNGPSGQLFPQLPVITINGQPAPAFVQAGVRRAAQVGTPTNPSTSLAAIRQNITSYLSGSNIPVDSFIRGDSALEIAELTRLQDGWNQGNYLDVSKQVRADIEAKGYAYEYDARQPLITSDYGVTAEWTNERGRTWVHPEADDEQLAKVSMLVDAINSNNERLSVELAGIGDQAYANRLVPQALYEQQRHWMKFIRETDDMVERAWARIRAGEFEPAVWAEHYGENWPKHVEKYIQDQDEILQKTLKQIEDVNLGNAELPDEFDYASEVNRMYEEYIPELEGREFDDPFQAEFKASVLEDRQYVSAFRLKAFEDVTKEVLARNRFAYGYINAADGEARRIDMMARGYIERHKDIWFENGGRANFRKESTKIWKRAAKDKGSVYTEVSDAIAEQRMPDFFKTDGKYLTNDLFYSADEVGIIHEFSDELGLSKTTKMGLDPDTQLMHVINKGIAQENQRLAAAARAQGGPEIPVSTDPPLGSVDLATGEIFENVDAMDRLREIRQSVQKITDQLADPTLNPNTVPVLKADLERYNRALEMQEIKLGMRDQGMPSPSDMPPTYDELPPAGTGLEGPIHSAGPTPGEIPFLSVADEKGGSFSILTDATVQQREVAINYLGKMIELDGGPEWTGYVRPQTNAAGFNEMADALTPKQREILEMMNTDVINGIADSTPPSQAAGYRHIRQEKLANLDDIDAGFNAHQSGNAPTIPYIDPADIDSITNSLMAVIQQPFTDAMAAVAPAVKKLTDFSILDYGDRMKVDAILDLRYPYSFWTTRSAWNWLQRIVSRPGLAAGLNRMQQGIEDQYRDDPRYRDFYSDKIRVNLPEGVQGFTDEIYAQVPIESMLPWQSALPDVNWSDVQDINSFWDLNAMIDKWFGLSEYAEIDYLESGFRAKQDWDPMQEGGREEPEWISKSKKQPGIQDVMTYAAVFQDVSAMLSRYFPNNVPAGGFLLGSGRWDKERLKQHTLFAAAEAVGIPYVADWTNFDQIREAGIARGNVDMAMLMEYAQVYENFERMGNGEMTPDELAAFKENPIYKDVAETTGVGDAFAGLTGLLSGIALSLMTPGEQAINAYKEMFDSDMWIPETPGNPGNPYGSQAALDADQELYPEAVVGRPGFYTSTGRQMDLDALDEKYLPQIDALIKAEPVNWGKQDQLLNEYRAAKTAIFDKWADSQAAAATDPKLWSIYGANPGEIEEITRNQVFHIIAGTAPKISQYYENPEGFDTNTQGKLDMDAYRAAYDEWSQTYPDMIFEDPTVSKALARLKAFEQYGISMTPETLKAEVSDLEALEDYNEAERIGIRPLDALVRILKDKHFGARDLREETYRRAFGPTAVEDLAAYNDEARERFGPDIFEKVIATYEEYKGRFGETIFEDQERYYQTHEELFPNYDELNRQFWAMDPDDWRRRTSFIANNPELKAAWDWKKKPEVIKEYGNVFEYWKYKTAISDAHGSTEYIAESPEMKDRYGVKSLKDAKLNIDAMYPGLFASKATSYIPDVLYRFDWFPSKGWDKAALREIYKDVALIPDSEMVWLISEAWDRGVPLEVVLAEEDAKAFDPSTPLPVLAETESEEKNQATDTQSNDSYGGGSSYYGGGSTYTRGYGGGSYGGGSYGGNSYQRDTSYKPYLPSYQPGGLKRRQTVTVK